MTEELITYETAILAKKKGCNLKSNNAYANFNNSGRVILRNKFQMIISRWDIENKVKAYSQSLLQRWLKEEHNIIIVLLPNIKKGSINEWGYIITSYEYRHTQSNYFELNETFGTYEECLELALQEALKLIK